MHRRFALLILPLAITLTAAAPAPRAGRPGPPRPPATTPRPVPDLVRVVLTTEYGPIEVELDAKRAPVSSANFLRYVEQRRFDGMVFYRAMKLAWGEQPNGLIQTGVRGDPKRVLKPIAHEPTDQTGILHKAGTLSMARFAPGTATGDFSILLSDMPGLDANPAATDAEGRTGYAAFGRVVSGMEVVRRIYDAPLSATKGDGVMRGQMLERPVRVLTARRAVRPLADLPVAQ